MGSARNKYGKITEEVRSQYVRKYTAGMKKVSPDSPAIKLGPTVTGGLSSKSTGYGCQNWLNDVT